MLCRLLKERVGQWSKTLAGDNLVPSGPMDQGRYRRHISGGKGAELCLKYEGNQMFWKTRKKYDEEDIKTIIRKTIGQQIKDYIRERDFRVDEEYANQLIDSVFTEALEGEYDIQKGRYIGGKIPNIIEEFIESEGFIDKIVERIIRKQLK